MIGRTDWQTDGRMDKTVKIIATTVGHENVTSKNYLSLIWSKMGIRITVLNLWCTKLEVLIYAMVAHNRHSLSPPLNQK